MRLKIAALAVLIVTIISVPAYAGTWQKNKDKVRYKRDDGSYVISDWVEDVDGRWYYFDADGLMVTKSWVQGKYYVDYEGVMLANTITPDGFRVNSHGEYVEHVEDYNKRCDNVQTITTVIHNVESTINVYYKKQYTSQNGSVYEIDGFVTDKNGNLYVNYHLVSGEGNVKIPITGYVDQFNNQKGFYYPFKMNHDVRLTKDSNRQKINLYETTTHATRYTIYLGNPIMQK